MCCYSFPSLGEGTRRKIPTDLKSVDKNEIPGVKEQTLKLTKENICSCRKIIMRVYK